MNEELVYLALHPNCNVRAGCKQSSQSRNEEFLFHRKQQKGDSCRIPRPLTKPPLSLCAVDGRDHSSALFAAPLLRIKLARASSALRPMPVGSFFIPNSSWPSLISSSSSSLTISRTRFSSISGMQITSCFAGGAASVSSAFERCAVPVGALGCRFVSAL